MKIATFNCNSARLRADTLLDWMAENEPDIVGLQEIKCENDKFPRDGFEELGYQVAVHGQKTWNGVAMLSRLPMDNLTLGMGDPLFPEDCRIIAATIGGLRILNTYVPNGTKVGTDKWDYKLRWLDRMRRYLAENQVDVWLGDINIAPKPDDVYDSIRMFGGVGHHPEEFIRLQAIIDLGYEDLFRKFTQGPGHYTYWEFYIKTAFERNDGWRIDHIYARKDVAERCTACQIDVEPRRGERPSDHTIVWAEFS